VANLGETEVTDYLIMVAQGFAGGNVNLFKIKHALRATRKHNNRRLIIFQWSFFTSESFLSSHFPENYATNSKSV